MATGQILAPPILCRDVFFARATDFLGGRSRHEMSLTTSTTSQPEPDWRNVNCDGCNRMFSDKRSNLLLSSAQGLEYRRKKSDMDVTLVNGCKICHKLRSMVPSKRWKIDVRNSELMEGWLSWCPPATWRSRAYKFIGFEQSSFPKQWLDDLLDPYICYRLKWDLECPSRILVTQPMSFKLDSKGRFKLRAQFGEYLPFHGTFHGSETLH